ncbi:hypothetical protein NDU88_002098 [Pleurodeles waltl]|uniref:Uncharacterized protein n=1 Tax=Pleurodeles waltl TaxID=8319 RepID=A0AAV7WNX2_PLEWA|nr:hypothetical protein NDU88_002098 [Pleurodeles waltl]
MQEIESEKRKCEKSLTPNGKKRGSTPVGLSGAGKAPTTNADADSSAHPTLPTSVTHEASSSFTTSGADGAGETQWQRQAIFFSI